MEEEEGAEARDKCSFDHFAVFMMADFGQLSEANHLPAIASRQSATPQIFWMNCSH